MNLVRKIQELCENKPETPWAARALISTLTEAWFGRDVARLVEEALDVACEQYYDPSEGWME
jgi:hypothetical protein